MIKSNIADRLLIIDDDDAFARLVKRVAIPLQYEVATTKSLEEFRSAANHWSPTLVFLDLNMPGCDGIETLNQLALAQCTAQVIVASGLDSRTINAAMRLGSERGLKMAGSLIKPAKLQDLRSLLIRFVSAGERSVVDELADAIKGNQLFLQYQPKLDCRSCGVTGVEALVRWRHPTRGVIPPDQFIGLAETSGLIDPMTDWVVSSAARQAAEWQKLGMPLDVAINISAENIRNSDLPDRLMALCRAEGVDSSSIILEVTETSAMRDTAKMMEVLARLRIKGFRLAMDDFGTGYSSLVQLQRMPFSELKIDRSFVMQMTRSKDCRVVVEILVELARKLELHSVAEGVENQETLDELLRLGCCAAQGYYIGRPADAAHVPEIIARYAPVTTHSAA
jgi:EAL domain-containing protein (putative c-di-GMP-specific phosphodiesterase class I)/ActR/RegA family two-component response regulator